MAVGSVPSRSMTRNMLNRSSLSVSALTWRKVCHDITPKQNGATGAIFTADRGEGEASGGRGGGAGCAGGAMTTLWGRIPQRRPGAGAYGR